jgi:phosphoenolpyruvate carboxykinase (ATP)
VLQPRSTWSTGEAYDEQAAKLAQMFRDNFEKFDDEAARAGGPIG